MARAVEPVAPRVVAEAVFVGDGHFARTLPPSRGVALKICIGAPSLAYAMARPPST